MTAGSLAKTGGMSQSGSFETPPKLSDHLTVLADGVDHEVDQISMACEKAAMESDSTVISGREQDPDFNF
jgi:hypothetical protein